MKNAFPAQLRPAPKKFRGDFIIIIIASSLWRSLHTRHQDATLNPTIGGSKSKIKKPCRYKKLSKISELAMIHLLFPG